MIAHGLIALSLALATVSSFADNPVCTKDDERQLSNDLKSLTNWRVLHASFKKFTPRCDDGFLAEGYTEAVVTLLARDQKSIPALAVIAKSDPQFLKFVLRHIDASADQQKLKRVLAYIKAGCPPNQGALCSAIDSATNAAIKEQ